MAAGKDGTGQYKAQKTYEKRYQKYTKNSSNKNENIFEQKLNNELLKYYSELIQFTDMVTIQIIYTNLETIFLKYFFYNKVRKEILIINTPHQYAHYVHTENRLYRSTLQLLKLLKEAILCEEEIQEERKRGDEIKKKLNCQIFEEEESLNVVTGKILEQNEEEIDEIKETNCGKLLDYRGIGRNSMYLKEKNVVDRLIEYQEKIKQKYCETDNYRGILSPSEASIAQSIFLDRDNAMFSKQCLYDYYLEYRHRYLKYHQRYIQLTDLIVKELEACLLLCQSLSTTISLAPKVQSSNHTNENISSSICEEEECILRMFDLEMAFQDLYSLQHELMTLVQVIHSLMIAMEITYYENIYQYSQSNPLLPSNLSSTTHQSRYKVSYTLSNLSIVTSALRSFNPSCPISSTYVIRCLYPSYSLSAVYLGYYFLTQEVNSRFKDSIPETERSRPSSRQNRLKEDSISYKSLLPMEEEGSIISSSQTSSRTESTKRKVFNPTKGRKMKYPTKEEVANKLTSKLGLPEEKQVDVEELLKDEKPSLDNQPINQPSLDIQHNLPKIPSAKFQQPSQSQPPSKLHDPQIKKTDTHLPPIPLLTTPPMNQSEADRDDISALTSPGGYQSERISSRN